MRNNIKKNNIEKRIVLLGLNGRGGPLTYSCILSSYLTKYCAVSLLLPSYSQIPKISKKVNVLRIRAPPSAIKTFFLTFNIFSHIKIIREINKTSPDIINILDIHPWYVIYWPFLKAKKIVTINDPQIHSGEGGIIMNTMINTVTRFLLKHADKIITLSKNQKDIVRQMGYKQEIIASKLGNQHEFSVGTDKKVAKLSIADSKNILFFGRIKDYKGLKYLLEALIMLKNRKIEFKLTIAGEGDLTPYKKHIEELGPKYIYLDNKEIYEDPITKYFKTAAFVVLPYTDATQTGIASIAYNFKKPLIVTNVGSLPEIVVNEKTGIVIPPKNVIKLSYAIEQMLKNPKKTKLMGIEGYQFLNREYNWDKIIKELYEKAYK